MERVQEAVDDLEVERSTSRLSLDDPILEDPILEEAEDDEGVESEAMNTDKPSAFAPESIPPRPVREPNSGRYSPLPWQDCFDEERNVVVSATGEVFHVYVAGSQGPVVFCLHGGGYSGLSFALVAKKMKEKVRIVAMDMRGHGQSQTRNDSDLSSETLCADVINVIKTMYTENTPAIVLVGHSMGGAIAVRVGAQRVLPTLAGVIVVDVVEGTAVASLVHMQKILSSRQMHFQSPDQAIIWTVKGEELSEILSLPAYLFPLRSNTMIRNNASYGELLCRKARLIGEAGTPQYEGLSEAFLSCPVAKLLMLAGTDRLDKLLTIGQMQGKFQMIVFRHSGHAIQEDEPDEFSTVVLSFIARNRIGAYGVEIPGLRRHIQLRPSN